MILKETDFLNHFSLFKRCTVQSKSFRAGVKKCCTARNWEVSDCPKIESATTPNIQPNIKAALLRLKWVFNCAKQWAEYHPTSLHRSLSTAYALRKQLQRKKPMSHDKLQFTCIISMRCCSRQLSRCVRPIMSSNLWTVMWLPLFLLPQNHHALTFWPLRSRHVQWCDFRPC